MVARDVDLWWPDTMAWDGDGNIRVSSNRLNLWFFGGMDFTGRSGVNFHIVKLQVGTNSYMYGEPQVTVEMVR